MPEIAAAGRDLTKTFGAVTVLRQVSVELRSGEIHALVGENGAGKSTLAKILAGVVQPSGGEILLDGKAHRFAGPKQAMADGVALIHQEPLTFSNLSIAENVFIGNQPMKMGRIDWKEMRSRTAVLFEELGVNLNPVLYAESLSVAAQQMIELASALSHEARVIICDETTASLTPKEVEELFVVLRRLRDQGKAIAFVSHRMEEIFAISDRVTVLRDGAKVAEMNTAETTVPEIVHLMIGRKFEESLRPDTASAAEERLSVDGLSGPSGFKDISLKVRAGEIVGLAGLVGAGRTQICESIFGIRRYTAGTIRVSGKPVSIRNPRDAIRLGLAMVPEDRANSGLHTHLNLRENTTLSFLGRFGIRGWLRMKREFQATSGMIQRLSVNCKGPEQPIRELSGGNQQKISMAKWLVGDPKILILDEPTRGVDIGAKDTLHRMIRDLAEKQGLAVLMVSSDLNEVLTLCDRILVIREGRLAGEFAGSTATATQVMMAAAGQVSDAA